MLTEALKGNPADGGAVGGKVKTAGGNEETTAPARHRVPAKQRQYQLQEIDPALTMTTGYTPWNSPPVWMLGDFGLEDLWCIDGLLLCLDSTAKNAEKRRATCLPATTQVRRGIAK